MEYTEFMKKIFKFLVLIIILIIAVGWFLLKDNPDNFIAYENQIAQMDSFETGNGTMRYVDTGSGQPILLIHGVPTSSWMYRNLTIELVDAGYRVIAPDLMGFGVSDRMAEYDMYDFDQQSDKVLDLMNHLGISNWEQVTHDMGGLVTWHMVKDAPENISHLYILNTILYKDTFLPPVDFNYNNPLHRFILNIYAHPRIGKLMLAGFLVSGTNGHHFEAHEKAGYWLPLRAGADGLTHFFTNTKEIKANIDEYRSWLVNSNVPVSIIWGENDSFLGSESVRLLQKEMNLSEDDVLILENKKHLIVEESYKEIVEFISN